MLHVVSLPYPLFIQICKRTKKDADYIHPQENAFAPLYKWAPAGFRVIENKDVSGTGKDSPFPSDDKDSFVHASWRRKHRQPKWNKHIDKKLGNCIRLIRPRHCRGHWSGSGTPVAKRGLFPSIRKWAPNMQTPNIQKIIMQEVHEVHRFGYMGFRAQLM